MLLYDLCIITRSIYRYKYIASRELTYPLKKGILEDDFPFPQVGYVSSLEGIHYIYTNIYNYIYIYIYIIQYTYAYK